MTRRNSLFSVPLFSILEDIERDLLQGMSKNSLYLDEWRTKAPSLVRSKYPSCPPMNHILKKDGSNVFKIAASGISRDQLSVETEGSTIIISAQMPEEEYDTDSTVLHHSLVTGGFPVSIRVPDTLDIDNFKAILNEGILTLIIPPKPELKPERKKIEIK